MNILLVCTGNTCRSPMAAGLLQKALPEHSVSSAGIYAQDGMGASENAVAAAAEKGIDLSAHRARRITAELLKESDLILCMTTVHKAMLEQRGVKCATLGEYAGTSEEVQDPFGGNLERYRACIEQLEGLINIIAGKVRNENSTL